METMDFFRNTGEKLELLEQMMERTSVGIGGDITRAAEQDLRAAMSVCLGCQATSDCRNWLAEDHIDAKPPSFCPNAQRLERLRDS
tara:strand:- start:392 stop:649 length:258 start_codon:yes stop_codon:yes gene_type:complete